MGATYPEIDDSVRAVIAAQRMFFVATSPLSGDGHVNISPKGLDSFRVLGPRRVAYLDHNGSGIETVSHVRENGRLTIMFCAFEGKPNILRLYGRGRVVEPGDTDFDGLLREFSPRALVRSIIVLDVTRIADSCGFGVPLYEYVGDRDQLIVASERKGPDGMRDYQRKKNAASIDGLQGLRSAR
jgi:hypothetical protein